MRCPYLNYSPAARTASCRCGTYPGEKAYNGATKLTLDYVERYCKNDSLDCPYNPERDKFLKKSKINKKVVYTVQNSNGYSRTEELARKKVDTKKSDSSAGMLILIIIIIAILIRFFN